MKESVAIVGIGRVGTSIGIALHNTGYRITGISSRRRNSSPLFSICSKYSEKAQDVTRGADIVFLTVTDDAIEEVCREIAGCEGFKSGSLVIHTSGALPSDVLNWAKGCRHLSLHPIKTFTSLAPEPLKHVFFSIEGDDTEIGVRIVRDLGGFPFVIARENKLLYHAALTFSSSYLVGLLALSVSLLRSIGLDERLAFQMVEHTLRDIERFGFEGSFTGPVTRMDKKTIRKELDAMRKKSSIAAEAYRALTLLSAWMEKEFGLLTDDHLRSLIRSLKEED